VRSAFVTATSLVPRSTRADRRRQRHPVHLYSTGPPGRSYTYQDRRYFGILGYFNHSLAPGAAAAAAIPAGTAAVPAVATSVSALASSLAKATGATGTGTPKLLALASGSASAAASNPIGGVIGFFIGNGADAPRLHRIRLQTRQRRAFFGNGGNGANGGSGGNAGFLFGTGGDGGNGLDGTPTDYATAGGNGGHGGTFFGSGGNGGNGGKDTAITAGAGDLRGRRRTGGSAGLFYGNGGKGGNGGLAALATTMPMAAWAAKVFQRDRRERGAAGDGGNASGQHHCRRLRIGRRGRCWWRLDLGAAGDGGTGGSATGGSDEAPASEIMVVTAVLDLRHRW